MRAKDVVGRKIVGIRHICWYNAAMRHMETSCVRIILDDGSEIFPVAFETADCPEATLLYCPPEPSPTGRHRTAGACPTLRPTWQTTRLSTVHRVATAG